jgi:protein phosphatase
VNRIIQLPDPSLVLLIGPAGAGKSTFAARHFKLTEVVSSDRCRGMICDDESNQSINQEAFGLLHHLTRLRLVLRRLTVVDATNLQDRARRPLLRLARNNRIPVVAIVFNITLETCLSNNQARPGRFVIEEIIRQHAEELPRTIQRLNREGYERIYLLDETDLNNVKIELIKIREEYIE